MEAVKFALTRAALLILAAALIRLAPQAGLLVWVAGIGLGVGTLGDIGNTLVSWANARDAESPLRSPAALTVTAALAFALAIASMTLDGPWALLATIATLVPAYELLTQAERRLFPKQLGERTGRHVGVHPVDPHVPPSRFQERQFRRYHPTGVYAFGPEARGLRRTGDIDFDAAVSLLGDPAGIALFNAEARAAIREVVSRGGWLQPDAIVLPLTRDVTLAEADALDVLALTLIDALNRRASPYDDAHPGVALHAWSLQDFHPDRDRAIVARRAMDAALRPERHVLRGDLDELRRAGLRWIANNAQPFDVNANPLLALLGTAVQADAIAALGAVGSVAQVPALHRLGARSKDAIARIQGRAGVGLHGAVSLGPDAGGLALAEPEPETPPPPPSLTTTPMGAPTPPPISELLRRARRREDELG
jgi:hypothetical protein